MRCLRSITCRAEVASADTWAARVAALSSAAPTGKPPASSMAAQRKPLKLNDDGNRMAAGL